MCYMTHKICDTKHYNPIQLHKYKHTINKLHTINIVTLGLYVILNSSYIHISISFLSPLFSYCNHPWYTPSWGYDRFRVGEDILPMIPCLLGGVWRFFRCSRSTNWVWPAIRKANGVVVVAWVGVPNRASGGVVGSEL